MVSEEQCIPTEDMLVMARYALGDISFFWDSVEGGRDGGECQQ